MSLLIDLFLRRGTASDNCCADDEIVRLIKDMRRRLRAKATAPCTLERYFAQRNIRELATDADLSGDGALVPLGASFDDGFRMLLRSDLPASRANFTVAHEICHTFFYERVPEMKFSNHSSDPAEERLCNLGAGELLMPSSDIRKQASNRSISLRTLDDLAKYYKVSLEAALTRLCVLKLWKAELSTWHKMTNGTFRVKRICGGRFIDWKWLDESVPNEVLASGKDKVVKGRTFWIASSPDGTKFRPVSYEIRKNRQELVVLAIRESVHETQGDSLFKRSQS